MTNKEKEIIDLIISNPDLKQNEIASILNLTRVTVGVHISNLMKRGIILGKHYVLNHELIKFELENNTTLFNEPAQIENKKIKTINIFNVVHKKMQYINDKTDILDSIKYTSFTHDLLLNLLKENKEYEYYYTVNLNKENSFLILNDTFSYNIRYNNMLFGKNSEMEIVCFNDSCYIKNRGNRKYLIENIDALDYNIISDDIDESIANNYLEKNKKVMLIIDKDKNYINNINNLNKLDFLVANIDVFDSQDIDFIQFKLVNSLGIKKSLIYDELRNTVYFIKNKNIEKNIFDNVYKIIIDNLEEE